MINLKYECFEWNTDDTYSQSEDYCDYIDMDTCKCIEKTDFDLNIIEYNIRGLLRKQKDLLAFLGRCTTKGYVDVIILVETWLMDESVKRVCLPGYEYYGTTRKNCKGGGVGFLVKNHLSFKGLSNFCSPDSETGIES